MKNTNKKYKANGRNGKVKDSVQQLFVINNQVDDILDLYKKAFKRELAKEENIGSKFQIYNGVLKDMEEIREEIANHILDIQSDISKKDQ